MRGDNKGGKYQELKKGSSNNNRWRAAGQSVLSSRYYFGPSRWPPEVASTAQGNQLPPQTTLMADRKPSHKTRRKLQKACGNQDPTSLTHPIIPVQVPISISCLLHVTFSIVEGKERVSPVTVKRGAQVLTHILIL